MGRAEPVHPDWLEPEEVDRVALQFIADGVAELAGFELAAISIVHEGRLHAVAIAGDDEARATLSALHPPVDVVLAELAGAEDWGPLKFVPHTAGSALLDEYAYVPDYEPLAAPDAWHPRDLLVALLEDTAGELRGVLSVDVPRNGLRPDAEQRRVLEVYARQAGRAVVTLLERQELERGLRRSEATSDHRRDLIDVFSHQLQNPVAAILGNLEILLEDLPAEHEDARPLRAIERAAGRIEAMVQDLLVLAKLDRRDGALPTAEVDLAALTADVAEAFHAEATGLGVTLRVEVPDTPLVVRGDRGELEDLVANLVSNGVKYSDPGGEVLVRATSAPGAVELHVRDRGIGIAEADVGRLFEEFFRSESLQARSRPGTGLGLAVVDRVVQRHRGRVEVDSVLGEGTTFRVVLPAV